MQYVGRAFDSVSKTWSSINPSTLSGAIDVIVVENQDGELSCSPFHVRFGKFQLLRPSQKKVDFIINGKLTNLPMKLGVGGEAFFVFETSKNAAIPEDLITSPVLSAASSPDSSPPSSPSPLSRDDSIRRARADSFQEPEFLDISQSSPDLVSAQLGASDPIPISRSEPELSLPLASSPKEAKSEKLQKLSKRLTRINIPIRLDDNGDLLLDMNGYKSNDKNIHDSDTVLKKLLSEEFGNDVDLNQFIKEDEDGNIKILSNEDLTSHHHLEQEGYDVPDSQDQDLHTPSPPSTPTAPNTASESYISDDDSGELNGTSLSSTNYVKTLRLTSDQLKFLDLKPGENDISFSVDKGKAIIKSKLYLWYEKTPIVISDIDGTITKSDALGHVLTMIGRDWTHPGVAKLFQDIALNGYNIMYLTARSVGQADSTRGYLRSIEQNGGINLPHGPVILSPDRTMAAFRREVILKKPEVFKMACLKDLKNLYNRIERPFYAGFGNRITDALSYRSVGIPSSRIFTINPDGEVHMELLELAGYKSTYIFINELVDHFFPPVNENNNDESFTDVNFWRDPLPEISDEEEDQSILDPDTNEESLYQPSVRVNLDDLDKDYDETQDDDYVNDEEEDYDYDDEYYDEDDENENETNNSEDGSFEIDDEDLDKELLEEGDESFDLPVSPISNRMFIPANRKNSGVSLNSVNVDGNITKASELLKNVNIND
jgi:phosphatidate phosphatase LPIN